MRHFYSSEEPVVIQKHNEIVVSQEEGIVEIIKKIQPLVLKVEGEMGCLVSADGLVATLDGFKKTELEKKPAIADLVDQQELQLGQRIVVVGQERVEAGILSQIKKDYLLTNIRDYVEINGAVVADLEGKVLGLAKVVQGRIRIYPLSCHLNHES